MKEDAISMSIEIVQCTHNVSCQQAIRGTPAQNDSLTTVMAELPPLPSSPIPSAVVQAASDMDVRQQERSIALERRRLLKNTQGVGHTSYPAYLLSRLLSSSFRMLATSTPLPSSLSCRPCSMLFFPFHTCGFRSILHINPMTYPTIANIGCLHLYAVVPFFLAHVGLS